MGSIIDLVLKSFFMFWFIYDQKEEVPPTPMIRDTSHTKENLELPTHMYVYECHIPVPEFYHPLGYDYTS